MKRFLLILILLSSAQPAYATPEIPSTFTFKGSGYGHGVGMSQIGAKGQALEGKSAQDILTYYFPGAAVTPVDNSQIIRVNVAHQVTAAALTISSQANDCSFGLASEVQPIQQVVPNSKLTFTMIGKQVGVIAKAANQAPVPFTAASNWTISWTGTDCVVLLKVGTQTMKLKYGSITVRSVPITGKGYKIEVVNSMRLSDEYLYGISEVPSSWPMAALESQAIVSRTYALSRIKNVRKDCDCNVYSSKYDQVYIGYSKEAEPKYGVLWRNAVQATVVETSTALAITYNGVPINVYFFSSSAGQTQRSIDVWGTDLPYLTSVPDSWSLDPKLNPKYANWVRVISQKQMAEVFGLPDVVSYAIAQRSATDSVMKITGVSSTGNHKTISISAFKVP
ncbi:MAG: SpoIID/LytB domain-containing protein, partial [Actinomycetes bacterium]